MHETLNIGIPVLTILLGVLLNQRGIERIDRRVEQMQSDLNQFYRIQAEQGAKVDILMEERRKP